MEIAFLLQIFLCDFPRDCLECTPDTCRDTIVVACHSSLGRLTEPPAMLLIVAGGLAVFSTQQSFTMYDTWFVAVSRCGVFCFLRFPYPDVYGLLFFSILVSVFFLPLDALRTTQQHLGGRPPKAGRINVYLSSSTRHSSSPAPPPPRFHSPAYPLPPPPFRLRFSLPKPLFFCVC